MSRLSGKLNPAGKNTFIKIVIVITVFAVTTFIVTTLTTPSFEDNVSSSDVSRSRENILATPPLKNNSKVFSNNSPQEPKQESFSIRQNYFVFFPVYPQPLVYVYNDSLLLSDELNAELAAPVGIAFNIEVTNLKSNPTGIRAYVADLQMKDGGWSRIYSLPTDIKHKLYLDESGNFERCRELEFEPDLFDRRAKSKILMPGESVGGWVFFEWSPELRENQEIHKLRLEIENTQNEISSVVLDFLSNETSGSAHKSLIEERGASDFFKGKMRVKIENGSKDLSNLPICPFRNE